jgi:hypothetical protein
MTRLPKKGTFRASMLSSILSAGISSAGQLFSRATTVCIPPAGVITASYAFAVKLPTALPVCQFVDENVSFETYLFAFSVHCFLVASIEALTSSATLLLSGAEYQISRERSQTLAAWLG